MNVSECVTKFIDFLQSNPCLVAAVYLVHKHYVTEHYARQVTISPLTYIDAIEESLGINFDCDDTDTLEKVVTAILNKTDKELVKTLNSIVDKIVAEYEPKIKITFEDDIVTAYNKCLGAANLATKTVEDDE